MIQQGMRNVSNGYEFKSVCNVRVYLELRAALLVLGRLFVGALEQLVQSTDVVANVRAPHVLHSAQLQQMEAANGVRLLAVARPRWCHTGAATAAHHVGAGCFGSYVSD